MLCADLVMSEQGSTLAYAVTEWGETGKLNDLCSSWGSGFWVCDVTDRIGSGLTQRL
jgi:hypothetical protein